MEKVKKILSVLALVTLMIGLSCKKKTPEVTLKNLPFHPLLNERDLGLLVTAIGDARIVLLGEASHGTTEYYKWRSAISKRLIQEKGFDMISAEAQWADSYRVNQLVSGPLKDSLQATALLHQYDRWPTLMWGNYEVASSIGHRAIGVQYNPNSERGNYVPSIMPSRYDAFVYIDKTTALKPLKIKPRNEIPDTYPSGYE
ncbi:MAG: erythromycin esterase family protein [Pedobacter sp.]